MFAPIDHAAMSELKTLVTRGDKIKVNIDPLTAVTAIGVLQLGLRHPKIPESTADIARRYCDGMIEALAPEPGPLRTLLERGYDPAHDTEA